MLAIVIPYYKKIFFEETLISLANQTNKNFKVYIGNDASPANPRFLIEKFEEKIDIHYQSFKDNLGSLTLTGHWERCLDLVQNEEWVMILGDDDILGENCVEEFYNYQNQIFENNSNLVRFATVEINQNSKITSKKFEHPVLESAENSYCRKLFGNSRSSLSEYIFKRSSYLKFGFTNYPLAWGSDNKAWLDFSEGKPIYTINEATVFFRISNSNISRKNFKEAEKWEARRLFFYDLFENRLNNFSGKQKYSLALYYEYLLTKVGKKSSEEIWKIFQTLLLNGYFSESIKLLRRIYILRK